MKFILYFIFFYVFFKILRRLISGPRPKRRVYVNWGNTQQGGYNPFEHSTRQDDRSSDEPNVGRFRNPASESKESPRLSNVEDAEFEEIKS